MKSSPFLALYAAVASSLVLAGCDQWRGNHPSDADLIARFETHKSELAQLVEMFRADRGLGRVGSDFTRPEDPRLVGVSAERVGQYRQLCDSIGARDCVEGYDAAFERVYGGETPSWGEEKDPIWVHVSSLGLSISGSSKGFVYSLKPKFPIVADLDAISPTRSGTWLRHIEGAWYVYYDYED